MKKFQYVFWNKYCPECNVGMVEDFWTELGLKETKRTGCYCAQCQKGLDFKIISDQELWLERIDYVLRSKEVSFVRKVAEQELIKKHGVEAHWFHVGRKVYIKPSYSDSQDSEIKDFEIKYTQKDKTLVYMLNSHLQRLYFFVPTDAVK
jgi:hypothetical protein